jgi:ABC-type uncharacterized transport system permease subunit
MLPPDQLVISVTAAVALGCACSGAAHRAKYAHSESSISLQVATMLAAVLNLYVLTVRTLAAEDVRHLLVCRFDVTLVFATTLSLVALYAQRFSGIRGLDALLLPVAAVFQIFAFVQVGEPVLRYTTAGWFVVHQLSLIAAGTFMVLGGGGGAMYLLLLRTLRRKQPSPLFGHLAPLETWERFGRWNLVIGFLLLSFGILAGVCEAAQSVRSEQSAGSDWVSDAFILGMFVIWGLYGVAIAASVFVPRFRGRRAAQLALGTGALLVFIVLVVEKVSKVH